jgi:hypothetical protein
MKISYSRLLNIVLVAILATSVFFMNTRSTIETKTATAGTYDPWLDYNEDGYIGIDDIFSTASSFGAEGDPTKNVNITGHATKRLKPTGDYAEVPPLGYWVSDPILVDGYSKMTILCNAGGSYAGQELLVQVLAEGSMGYNIETLLSNGEGCIVKTYDVPDEMLALFFHNIVEGYVFITIEIYLVA